MRGLGFALFGLLIAGCGYTFTPAGGPVPSDVKTIHIGRVDVGNGDLVFGDALARELRRYIRRRGRFTPSETEAGADAVLAVKVDTDVTRPVAFDEFDEVLSHDSRFVVSATLTDSSGNSIWDREGIELTRSSAAVDEAVVISSSAFQSDERLSADTLDAFDGVQLGENRLSQARDALSSDMARAIYSAMTEGY